MGGISWLRRRCRGLREAPPRSLHPACLLVALGGRALRRGANDPSLPPPPSTTPSPAFVVLPSSLSGGTHVPQIDDAVVDVGDGKGPPRRSARRGGVGGRVASAAGPGRAQLLSGILHSAQRLATGGRWACRWWAALVVGATVGRVDFSCSCQDVSLRWLGRFKAPCRGRISSQCWLRQGHPALARNTATGARPSAQRSIGEA